MKARGSGESVPAPALETDVVIKVSGMVLRATVSQKYYNASDKWMEGVYTFPLPENAAVDYMKLVIGERIIEGQIKEKAEAKKVYEQAKREGKKASLVEQERPNVFTTSVANIAPGEKISVTIEYQQEVKYDSGKFSFRFPMVIGPRYIPGVPTGSAPQGEGWAPDTDSVPDASRITPPVRHPSEGEINPVRMTVLLDAGVPLKEIKSLYHEVDIDDDGGTAYTISLEEGETPANKDFALEWIPEEDAQPRASVFFEEAGGKKFALIMVIPPAVDPDDVKRIPKETVYILDRSGSMEGTSIIQAKKALQKAIDSLYPEDTFNIVSFSDSADILFPACRPADEENIAQAKRYVENVQAGGGTEMMTALKLAFVGDAQPGRLRQVIFITDGNVGNENELFTYIKSNLAGRRLFTVGIGSAPNSYFMTKAAEEGKGSYTFIGNLNEVEVKMSELFAKIENPMLKDISVNWGNPGPEIYPSQIPDLYSGEPVVLVAMFGSEVPAVMNITGLKGGEKWSSKIDLLNASKGSGIAKLWAKRKINSLMDEYQQSNNEATKTEVVQTALAYGLVTKFTSLVAVDITPVKPADEQSVTKAVETNLPEGWDYDSVFGQMPQGGTAADICMIIGIIIWLLAILVKVLVHKK
jgi:Ca-activated chloride channel family protein